MPWKFWCLHGVDRRCSMRMEGSSLDRIERMDSSTSGILERHTTWNQRSGLEVLPKLLHGRQA